jgi:hypothetical protein
MARDESHLIGARRLQCPSLLEAIRTFSPLPLVIIRTFVPLSLVRLDFASQSLDRDG